MDYLTISQSATAMVQNLVPCWTGTNDLLPQWACMFEWILYNRANKINDKYNMAIVTSRYNDAIAYLKEIAETYCLNKQDAGNKNILENMFQIGQSVHHPRVDFL